MAPSSSSLIVNFLRQNIRRIQNPQRPGRTIGNLVVKGGGDGTQQEPQIMDGKLQLQFTEQMAIELKILNFVPALSVWNSALLDSLRIERTDLVWDLYATMMESGLVGDVDTVGYLIRAFCKDNKLYEPYELLRQVSDAGHTPDNIAFTKLISGFSRDGNYAKNGMGNEALRVFNDLKDRGYAPDRVMYTTMIDGLCKMGRLGEARKLWFEMIHKGFKQNEYTYNALMDGYCKAGFCQHGKTDKAHELFEEMANRGINHDVVTYNTLIQGLCKEGKVVEAMNLFNELMVLDLQPYTSSYTPQIQALCEEGKAQEAIELWKDTQNRSLEPLVCTHDYIITGLCKQGNPTEGMEWLLTSKLRPRRNTFNRLVEDFSSNNRFDDAACFRLSIWNGLYS
ncbi:pentatricopeptide repeat-containing protein At5g18950-like [Macadamia integrifolia]|uniref:pentatricopeptide repeat-containing protein At5g18950-like n=1 Tax=Macadamia integrifolia TaxID=60698 RepID=UPI001C4E3E56|nr:pentatricopeptide repeat-containing protein At5g18950-like [Macadamia integrifolia]